MPRNKSVRRAGSEAMIKRAKEAVCGVLNKSERQMSAPSPIEQAFLDASQESTLTFDYDRMRQLVNSARFGSGMDEDDEGYNDNTRIVLNRDSLFSDATLRHVLFHECLHNTVERSGRPGNPNLSEDVEHLAMALLGDRDEQVIYFVTLFNMDYVNEDWLTIPQRKRRKYDPEYLKDVYEYFSDKEFSDTE